MNYLSAENLSKTFGDRTLFSELSFGLRRGDKAALIAVNGSGKSTLFRILAGRELPDTGKVTFRDGIRIAWLEQDPQFPKGKTIDEIISFSHTSMTEILHRYEQALHDHSLGNNAATREQLESATSAMDQGQVWDYERRLKQLLSLFRISDTRKQTGMLSGGDRKRLALALALLDDPELLILDEPTNHLDIDMIEWLEDYLSRSGLTLLMVTHDRYFLDRVCSCIFELSRGRLFYHEGNYEHFLEKKAERDEVMQVETEKARQLMKKELEWLRRMPRARTHKSKSRIQAFDTIRQKATGQEKEHEMKLQVNIARMGGKILEINALSKKYGDIKIVEDFSYVFKRGERIGVIGRNGVGKTSFINLITGGEKADSGRIDVGQTIVFGYYRQAGVEFPDDARVIDIVKEISEVVETGDGSTMPVSRFLEYFMFPPETQYKPCSVLSGGEKRRLNLLTVLIKNPNFLILDEPTNDLDLLALNRLEEFLLAYTGCLIVVSHDRFFLDRLTDHLFVFEGDGRIRDYYGIYTDYKFTAERERQDKEKATRPTANSKVENIAKQKTRLKRSFKEQREYEILEKEIEMLEQEKARIESEIGSVVSDYGELNRLSARLGELVGMIDAKTLRWMELDELGRK